MKIVGHHRLHKNANSYNFKRRYERTGALNIDERCTRADGRVGWFEAVLQECWQLLSGFSERDCRPTRVATPGALCQ